MDAVEGGPFDVDEVRAERQRFRQDAVAILLGAGKAAAFPFRAAGHYDRLAPPLERGGDVQVSHTVETEFDHVGHRSVARGSQVGH